MNNTKIKIGQERFVEFFILGVGEFFILEQKNKKPAFCLKFSDTDLMYNSYDYTNKKEIFVSSFRKVLQKQVVLTYD